jgi:hypothetical protein
MTRQNRNPLRTLHRMAEVFGAAITAAAAVRNHRRPSDHSLAALGIDPEHFPASDRL